MWLLKGGRGKGLAATADMPVWEAQLVEPREIRFKVIYGLEGQEAGECIMIRIDLALRPVSKTPGEAGLFPLCLNERSDQGDGAWSDRINEVKRFADQRFSTICGRVLSMMARSSFCSWVAMPMASMEALRSPMAASNSMLVIFMPSWVFFMSLPS